MLPHRMRLRGPWTLTPMADGRGSITAVMPAPWSQAGLGDYRGTVRHARRFGKPRQLESHERAWIVCDQFRDKAAVMLNGEILANEVESPFEIEVTGRLQERNELWLDIHGSTEYGGLTGETALEIRAQAWLANLCARHLNYGLTVAGEVRGSSAGPLDLYVLVGRFTVIQGLVSAGRRFEFTSEPIESWVPEEQIVVELVSGSLVWHSTPISLAKG